MWSKLYGDSLFQEAQSAVQTSDGGYMVCGSRDFTTGGNYDILLFKTDSIGNIQWSKTYGGPKGDASYKIHLNQDGSCVVSGYTNSMGYGHSLRDVNPSTSTNHSIMRNGFIEKYFVYGDDSTNIFLMKTDATGDTIWTRSYGDSLQEEAFLSDKCNDGGFILAGFSDYHNSDSSQMLVIKTDSMGWSGCKEYASHPIIVSSLLSEAAINYIENAGMITGALSLTSANYVCNNTVYCLMTTGIDEENRNDIFSIYPNPASTRLIIKGNRQGLHSHTFSVSIMDITGKVISTSHEIDWNENEIEINTSALQAGMYLVEIDSNEIKTILKFVKD
jgi:hypothetical protein